MTSNLSKMIRSVMILPIKYLLFIIIIHNRIPFITFILTGRFISLPLQLFRLLKKNANPVMI